MAHRTARSPEREASRPAPDAATATVSSAARLGATCGTDGVHALNYRKDPHDHRAFLSARRAQRARLGVPTRPKRRPALPASYNILSALSLSRLPVWDQGNYGSCTAHGTCLAAFIVNYAAWTSGAYAATAFDPSRFYAYNMTRMYAQTPLTLDEGAYIFDACAEMERARCAPTATFPYASGNFSAPPPLAAVTSAAATPWAPGFDYVLIAPDLPSEADLTAMKAAIANDEPIVFGFEVFSSAMSAAASAPYALTSPAPFDANIGGHCVTLIGYDDARVTADGAGAFRARNSWGADWADGGDFWISYAYMAAHAFDFYKLTSA